MAPLNVGEGDADPMGATVVVHEGPPIVLEVGGEIDLAVSEWFLGQVESHLADQPGCEVVFDLTGVEFLDSSGLGVLVAISRDHPLRIGPTSDAARRVIELAGLAESWQLAPLGGQD